jgi:peptidoglycan lytic transglycosylase G
MRGRRLRRLAVAAAGLAALAFLWALFQPFAGDGGDPVRITIPKQAGVSEIGDILDRKGVVPSAALFSLRARVAGDSGDLKPGAYTLREDMSYGDVLDVLVAGPSRNVVQLTIPEGLSRREIAPLAGRAGVRGDYLTASKDGTLLAYREYGLGRPPASLEGFLFPATYELRRGTSASALVGKQLAAFRQNFAGVSLGYARRKNLTRYDVITIASMVERETRVARERPLVAAVIYNRLHARQPLGIDATIRYETGNWTRPLTKSELAGDSPYNTRTRAGLPPTPIGNPGLASIEAAAHPARVGYLYYVVKPGTCGEHAFSDTFAQFQRDQERYNQARDAAGGRSPTKC